MSWRRVRRTLGEDGLTLVEVVIVVLVIALLVSIAVAAFLHHEDPAHDAQAQTNLTTALRAARGEHLIHDRSYTPDVARMAERLNTTEPSLLFHDYDAHRRPSLGARDISVTVEDENMISLCAHSQTGRYYCVRGDEIGQLQPPIDFDGTDRTQLAGGPGFGSQILAALNPLQLLSPEPAFALRSPKFGTTGAYKVMSRCTAWTEPDARACLATRLVREGANPGPNETGRSGWVDGEDLPPPPVDPWQPGDPLPDGQNDACQIDPLGCNPGDPGDPGDPGNPGGDPGNPGGDPGDPGGDPGDPDNPGGDPPNQVMLNVTVSGSGTVSGPGVSCPGDCSESYDLGSVVSLTASPGAHFSFSGWSGDCYGSGGCDLTMDSTKLVDAAFVPVMHGLDTSVVGSGSGRISGSQIDCPGDCSGDYPEDSKITLTADPSNNSLFGGWSGACSGTDTTCEVTMSSARQVSARFDLPRHQLSVTRSGSGTGTVSGPQISCGSDCAALYDEGSVVTLTAAPAAGSTFGGWSGACSGLSSSCTVTMSSARSVGAQFSAVPRMFEIPGLIGLDSVTLKNSTNIDGVVGSNGQVSLNNSNNVDGILLDPGAPNVSVGNSSNIGYIDYRDEPYDLPRPELGDSATNNDNARISNGLDAKSGNVTYDPATRSLNLGNSSNLTLGGGVYNFCSITMANSVNLSIAPGASVVIYLDSPDRLLSGCPANSGSISMNNSINISNPSGIAARLLIVAYGSSSASTIEFKNSGNMSAGIYAPYSDVVWKNSINIDGGIVARSVEFKNSANFSWDPSLAQIFNDGPN